MSGFSSVGYYTLAMILDCEPLRYAETHSKDAFAELVRRHINLVYSATMRQVNGDSDPPFSRRNNDSVAVPLATIEWTPRRHFTSTHRKSA
jgi:hypothetical protein